MHNMYKFITLFLFILIPLFSFSNKEKKMTVVELIESSEDTLKKLEKNIDIKNFREYLAKSRAILIFPEIYEGSFLFGAKG